QRAAAAPDDAPGGAAELLAVPTPGEDVVADRAVGERQLREGGVLHVGREAAALVPGPVAQDAPGPEGAHLAGAGMDGAPEVAQVVVGVRRSGDGEGVGGAAGD